MTALTLSDFVERLHALEVGKSFLYHTGFIARERASSHETRRALDRLILLVQILTSAELIFPFQQKVSEGIYNYGVKKLHETPDAITNIAKDITNRSRFKDSWFVDTKLAQVIKSKR